MSEQKINAGKIVLEILRIQTDINTEIYTMIGKYLELDKEDKEDVTGTIEKLGELNEYLDGLIYSLKPSEEEEDKEEEGDTFGLHYC